MGSDGIAMPKMIMKRVTGLQFEVLHGEAFRLMRYANPVSGRTEWIWNSRDGSTPMAVIDHYADPEAIEEYAAAIATSEGVGDHPAIMRHVAWHEDAFVPNFVPPLGMRVFVSWEMAPTVYREAAIDQNMEAGRSETREAAAASIPDGDPCCILVDDGLHQHFHILARDNPIVPPPVEPPKGSSLILPRGLRH